ncbi:S-layer homology domain-containing protein [Paenibacillus agricola]|uniref:S-layer homology domain-containing protein n=1 Tax=Paenibacillus agricola TaxID=2716264 RepID=A0ABX0J2A6_9BACL|nr:S-layer homology domain-containing protein [Paenibacillus agricola]NHN29575.1 S-layer homology domain-containing protein [Paenibacillus agricola]
MSSQNSRDFQPYSDFQYLQISQDLHVVRAFRVFRMAAFIMGLLLILVLVFSATGWSTHRVFAESAEIAEFTESQQSFAQIIRLADDERKPVYLNMSFLTEGWIAGKVINKKPYTVVVGVNPESFDGDIAYQLQVWRGVAARVEDDLLTEWDLLELNAEGKVIRVTEGYERALQGYFKAQSQSELRSIDDVQRYPWANLPTDSEAKAARVSPIPKDGSIDVYGILPREGSIAISNVADKVKPLLDIPAQVLDKQPTWWQSSPDLELEPDLPTDIASHWAQAFIIDLMKKSIIEGYEDQTIRPNGILTQAEFTTMLVRALDLDLIHVTGAATGDTGQPRHWAQHEVDIAVESELIMPDSPIALDAPISRLETARLLASALQTMKVAYKQAAPLANTWPDLQNISQADTERVALLAAEGIFNGDAEGKFRPDDSLTRAEASKVLSLFLRLK